MILRNCQLCGREFSAGKGSGQGRWCSDACRFWGKVAVRGEDECWEWIAAKTGKGYGKIGIGYREINAHRVAYEMFHGDIPAGLLVCHRCDNRPCVNPAHLFVGTARDNTHDAIKKRRLPSYAKTKVYREQRTLFREPPKACVHGHPGTPENAYIDRSGNWICRPCRRFQEGRRRKRKRERNLGGRVK